MLIQPILGIDIAKKKFDVAFLYENKIKNKVFTNNSIGFSQLIQWLRKIGISQLHACMEATSTYGEALAIYLINAGFTVSMVNPAQIKYFAKSQLTRNKTDKADATLIAQFCLKFQPSAWHPLASSIRKLQALVRRLEALTTLHNQETNRIETAHPVIVVSLKKIIAVLAQEIKDIKQQVANHIDQQPDLRQKRDLLDSIPGVGEATIAQILAFIVDISRFKNAKQIVAFMGLNPKQHTSGSSVHGRTHISKTGNSALRKAFYMPALTAKHHNPIIKRFCNRLKCNGKNNKSIICAAMRKLIHIIYGVLKSGQPFNPLLN
jgi:transposase